MNNRPASDLIVFFFFIFYLTNNKKTMKLYLVAYFSSFISFLIFVLAFLEVIFLLDKPNNAFLFGQSSYLVMVLAAIFPLLFYYYITFPVIREGYKKLREIRKKDGSIASYYAILGNTLGSLVPFNGISRNMLVALVN